MNLTSLTTKDWHARAAAVRYETRHFIDGKYVDSIAGGRFTVVNPATGAPLCEVSAGTAADCSELKTPESVPPKLRLLNRPMAMPLRAIKRRRPGVFVKRRQGSLIEACRPHQWRRTAMV